MINYTIEPEEGHYAVYIDGKFYCTADTYADSLKEVKIYEEEHND